MRRIVLFVAILHLVWGTLLLIEETPTYVTAIHSFMILHDYHVVLGLILIVASGLAIWREYLAIQSQEYTWTDFLWYLPQVLLLLLSGAGATIAILDSSFADGFVRPRAFIFADQIIPVLLIFFYVESWFPVIRVHSAELVSSSIIP